MFSLFVLLNSLYFLMNLSYLSLQRRVKIGDFLFKQLLILKELAEDLLKSLPVGLL